MAYKPGETGNKLGRPVEHVAFKRLCRNAVDAYVLKAWINEVVTMGAEWVKCSEYLANYAYGKPAQLLEVKDVTEIEGHVRLTIDEVKANARFQLEKEKTLLLEANNNDDNH